MYSLYRLVILCVCFVSFPTNMDPQNVIWKLKDCFGKEYVIVEMAGSGFCGFHCLAYSLSGDLMNYSGVIRDCVTIFGNVPELFRLRTNFASRGESATLENYEMSMRDAQRHVEFGLPIDSDMWCEDGHFAAISLLYNVAIFVYSTRVAGLQRVWYAWIHLSPEYSWPF